MKEGSIPRPRPAAHVWRAAAATVRGFVMGTSAEDAARSLWPDDPVTPIVLRGASTQATTTDPSWAGPLARLSVSEAIEEAVSMSAIGDLIARGAFKIDLGRNASVRAPGRITSAANAGTWVQEGKPIPARILNMTGPLITPHKIAVIVTLTQQLIEASNIEQVVRVMLSEAAGLALDAAVFSTLAAAGGQPGGILNGLTPLTSTVGGGFDAVGQDLGNLVSAIAANGGGRNAFFVASPSEAIAIRFYAGGQFRTEVGAAGLPVAASAALADGTVVCIEPGSLAISADDPQFTASKEAAVHQEDTTPAENLPTGSPVKSMFQIDATALKMTLWADWGMRAPHVSYLTGATW